MIFTNKVKIVDQIQFWTLLMKFAPPEVTKQQGTQVNSFGHLSTPKTAAIDNHTDTTDIYVFFV
jgi:hypothetical protein